MVATVKWFDLSRFGARLRVVPDSPLRGTSLTCLDIYDQQAFTSGWQWDKTPAHRTSLQEAWAATCERLGFGAKPTTIYENHDDGTQVNIVRFLSPRLQFTLKDIQALVPGVQASDLVEMEVEDIAYRVAPAENMPGAWQQFVGDVLAREAVGVWTPKRNPLGVPWHEAKRFDEAYRAVQEDRNPIITRRGLGGSSQLRFVLDDAGYRTNALVPFYVDEAAALADGWRADEIEQVDLPYALPLWANGKGQIQALADVRFVPELMDADPVHYLGAFKNGLVVGPLREVGLVREIFERQMVLWDAWALDPQSLQLPDYLWGSITEAVAAHADLCEKYPTVITAGLSDLSDGKELERRGQFRAKPLVEMTPSTMFWVARICQRYVRFDDGELARLQAVLERVLSRGHELMAEHMQALAERELAEIASVVRGERDSLSTSELGGESSEGFRQWFGNSQVVADNGTPLKVYHGTFAQFDEFDLEHVGTNTSAGNTSLGFFFIADRELARQFAIDTAGIERRGENPRVIEAYLSIKKPMRLNSVAFFGDEAQAATLYEIFTGEQLPAKEALAWINEEIGLGEWFEVPELVSQGRDILVRDGFDGIISEFGAGNVEYVVFHPDQIRVVDPGLVEQLDADQPKPGHEQKVRHEDAGEKIGGARKDFAKRAMQVDDLEVMNDAERDLYVVKKNVWGPLNYAQMRADGVCAEAAVGIKLIKDKLLSAPARRKYQTAENDGAEARYIEAIGVIRDRFSTVKTLDEFNAACKDLYEIGARQGDDRREMIYGTPMQVQWGQKVSNILFGAHSGRTPIEVWREIRRKVETWGREPTEDEKWRSMIKPKRKKTEEQREEEKAKAEADRQLHRPHLDRVQRSGEDWRGGRDIVADDLIEHFGFRGVEFGNWLPQDERQQVLNMAFDSFCDLAQVLKLPPRGLSLDGTLAVAFGSRGSGGKHAALAHYEPARTVINLTRMNGAGTLAHEWMHALDHHLGQGRGYLSEASASGTAMSNLSGRMQRRLARADEILEKSLAGAKQGQEYARSWYYGQSQEARDKIFDALQAEYDQAEAALYNEARARIDTARRSPTYAKNGFNSGGAVDSARPFELADRTYQVLRGLCTSKSALSKVKPKIEPNLNFMMTNLAKVVTVRAAQDLGVELPEMFCGRGNCVPSDFYREAEKLDKTRSAEYWATTRELFARAGAAYVSDRIEEAGGRSDYLVFGADEQRYADNPLGNPNPTGEDRKDLAVFFDALMAEYRIACLKEAEQDAVAEP